VAMEGLHVASTPLSTDVDLHGRVVAGDESALGELYTRFSGFVQSLARRVTCDADAARDVTQEVFVHFWEHPLAFDPDRGALRSWFAMLAHRRAVDWIRREERRRKPPDHLAAMVVAPALPGVDEEWEAADEVRRVREIVANLPEKLREAIRLAFYRGLTYREVAVELGIPEGTAKSRMRIALQRIAQNLAEEGMGA
jgi:RNA polymerase sigma-70 factor, ECF subfamily